MIMRDICIVSNCFILKVFYSVVFSGKAQWIGLLAVKWPFPFFLYMVPQKLKSLRSHTTMSPVSMNALAISPNTNKLAFPSYGEFLNLQDTLNAVSFLKAWSPEGRVSRNGAHRQLICVCHHLVLRRASVAFGENAVLLGMAPRTCKRLCHFRKSARGG